MKSRYMCLKRDNNLEKALELIKVNVKNGKFPFFYNGTNLGIATILFRLTIKYYDKRSDKPEFLDLARCMPGLARSLQEAGRLSAQVMNMRYNTERRKFGYWRPSGSVKYISTELLNSKKFRRWCE